MITLTERATEELSVDFLGDVPIDPRIVEGGDAGRPILVEARDSEAARSFGEIAEKIVRKLADANTTWVTT